ncbi:hypothetical protein B0H10DRAFT_2444127 [Mycena sp. CBHHK59/15]|nr:hypothetical protein B0H10DRAFT_2444127 [Mycena sp. CBHHK59/15]
MAPSATFCDVPVSTSVDPLSPTSLVSLNWILSAGIPAPRSVASGVLTLPCGNTVCSMHTKLSVTSDLPYDLVLGRDWLFFCRETLPHTSFDLSSGTVSPGHRPPAPLGLSGDPASNLSAMDVDTQHRMDTPSPASARTCICPQYNDLFIYMLSLMPVPVSTSLLMLRPLHDLIVPHVEPYPKISSALLTWARPF